MSGSPPVASMSCSASSLLAFKRAWTSAQATVGCRCMWLSNRFFSVWPRTSRCAVFMSAPGNGAFSARVVACCTVSGPKRRRMACPAATYMGASAVGCRTRVGWHRRHGFTPPGRCGGGQAAVSQPHGVGVSSCPSCQLLGRGHGQAEGPLTRFYSSNALPQAGSADKILFRNASDRACTTGA